MIYTPRLFKAVKFAIKTHDLYAKQKRKGKDISYIEHPLTVGIILAKAGCSEDIIIAGILHDTIEDSIEEKKVTKEMITERFGNSIADIVVSVTEIDPKLSWNERKKIVLEHIKDFPYESLLVKSADLVSNISEIIDDHARYGDDIFERFNAPEPKKENTLHHYIKAIETIISRKIDNPLLLDLEYLKKKMLEIIN